MQIGILIGQSFAFDFSPDHKGVHGPSDALFTGFLLIGRRLFAADAPATVFHDRRRHVGHHRLIPAHLLLWILRHDGVMLTQVTRCLLMVLMMMLHLMLLRRSLHVIACRHCVAVELLLLLLLHLLLLRPVVVIHGKSRRSVGMAEIVAGR